MKPKTLTGALVLGTMLFTASTSSATTPKKITKTDPAALQKFGQCSDVRDHLAGMFAQQIAQGLSYPDHRYWGRHGMGGILDSTDAPARSTSGAEEGSGPSTYTTTNVQEQGVDENDTVKTDGKFVYAVAGKSVAIVKSWPIKDSEVVSRIDLGPHATPSSLFLRGDKLVVISSVYEPSQQKAADDMRPVQFNGTRVSIVDISDRDDPRIERSEDIEGWSYQSRLVGNDVYLAFNAYVQGPPSIWDYSQYTNVRRPKSYLSAEEHRRFVKKASAKIQKKVRAQLEKTSLKHLLPQRRVVRGDGRIVSTQALVSCQELRTSGSKSSSLVGIAHIDLDNARDFGATALFGDGWNIYASTDNLYITGTTYGWWDDQNADDWYRTSVHKFRLRGRNGQPEYAASGKVDGWLLNQFSMSEWDGHLRIGTTDWNVPGRNGGGNHLTVLGERDGKLVQTGAVRGLAKGERIFSMRMVGDIGYMVTFRQTDPLYTIDLSDPTAPKVMGELKINGFSSYIHPLGPNHLLTVGQDADDDGRVLGLHLQIFDVTDLSNPTRVHHKQLTSERWSSWSPAMWDHHAFTFDARRNLLVLPMTGHHPEQFSGAMVLKADPKSGFEDMGFLTQTGKEGRAFCEKAHRNNRGYGYDVCGAQQLVWQTQIQRTIIVDDYVLALSAYGLTAHVLQRPHEVVASVYTFEARPIEYGYNWRR